MKQQIPSKPELSARQLDILQLVATGKSDQEIADSLKLSVHTVKTHLKIIYRKWEVRNRLEATNIYNQLP